MRRALMEAQAAFDEDEIPVGAIIVCKDRIISRAHNLTEMLTDVTAHAEMQAITSGANMLGGKYLKVFGGGAPFLEGLHLTLSRFFALTLFSALSLL